MRRFLRSLRGRLSVGVIVVLVLVMTALAYVNQSLLLSIDDQLFMAIEARALTNANSIANAIAYEVVAKEDSKVKGKLADFRTEHLETLSIGVFNAGKALVVEAGEVADSDSRKLIGEFDNLDVGDTRVDEKQKLVVAAAPIIDEGVGKIVGYVVYTESLAAYYADRDRSFTLSLVAMGLGILVLAAVVFMFGGWIAKPIIKLVGASERIAAGDLREIQVDEGTIEETRSLAGSIKHMAGALQTQVSAIKGLTRDVSEVSRGVAEGMALLASSASQQAAAVAETASTVEEMEQAGRTVSGNASQIVEAAEKTTEASIRGRQAVDTSSGLIMRIKEDSQTISAKSKALVSSVEEIGNIIGSVNAIAEQSKILAVNASIEAAKAGEYGVGFAVVAQEVKDLAQQSKEATLQITGTLNSIRRAIENMVTTASNGEQRTEEGVLMIAKTGAIVNDLSDAIRENSEFANIINTSVNQQTVGLSQIATAIEQINVSAMENQEISRKIADSTRQMTSTMEELSDLVGQWKTRESQES
jgi:methyl-accepting chemotaxis protein